MIFPKQLSKLSVDFGISKSSIQAIIEVESGGNGFDRTTGLIKIQFEPHWFKILSKQVQGFWLSNKVDVQSQEWKAYNDAYQKNPNKAMESTSWGSMQVMGFNWKRLGFKSVEAMVDFAVESEINQVWLGLKYLQTDKIIYNAIKKLDWKTVAKLYNGADYWKLGYDKKLAKAELKYR